MFDDEPPFAPKSETHERIAIDLHAIISSVLLTEPPADMPKQHEQGWRWHWLMACVWGYCQTDLGVPHQSGEDGSGWREDAAKQGLDMSSVRGLTYAERRHELEQQRLYAAMITTRALAEASKPEPR